jgi:hypothetical protein
MMLQCRGEPGGILCGHYHSRVKFINLGDKIVPINSFGLGDCRNYSICSDVKISPFKNLIWNEFGGNLEGLL